MKKFTKLLAASSMLVGLAACGKNNDTPVPPVKTWDVVVSEFLTKNGVTDIELPSFDDECFDGIQISAEVLTDDYGDYVVVSFDTETPSKIGYTAVIDLVNTDGWVEQDEDMTEYVSGGTEAAYWLTMRSGFGDEGNYALATLDVVEEDSWYVDEENPAYCQVIYEVYEGYSAAEATELLDELTSRFELESLIKEEEDLADVSPYWLVDAGLGDIATDLGAQIAAVYGGELTDYYTLEEDGFNDFEMNVAENATAKEAIDDLFGYINTNKDSLELVVDEVVTTNEEEDGSVWYSASFINETKGILIELESMEMDLSFIGMGVVVYLDMYTTPLTEDALYLASVELSACDFSSYSNVDSVLCDATVDIVNDIDYILDSSVSSQWFYELTSEAVNSNGECVIATFMNNFNDFSFSVSVGTPRVAFPSEMLSALFAGFKTPLPTLAGKFEIHQLYQEGLGDIIGIIGYDNRLSSDPDCYGATLLKFFQDNDAWTIESETDEDGTTYFIESTEVVKEKAMRLQLSFYDIYPENYPTQKPVMEAYWYLVPAPQPWFTDKVNAFLSGWGFDGITIPTLPGEDFFLVDNSASGQLAIYARKAGLVDTFKAGLNPEQWNMTQTEMWWDAEHTSTVTVYDYYSKNPVSVQGTPYYLCLEFFEHSGADGDIFQMELTLTRNGTTLDVDTLNNALTVAGVEDLFPTDFTTIGFSAISTASQSLYDVYQFTATYDAGSDLIDALLTNENLDLYGLQGGGYVICNESQTFWLQIAINSTTGVMTFALFIDK